MKKVLAWLEDFILPAVIIAGIFWLMYKVAAGVFHLLDKLIDKL